MPASAASSRPEELTQRLRAGVAVAAGGGRPGEGEALLKALREVKNQIIGNKTKKIAYLHLDAVPNIVSILASVAGDATSASPDAAAMASLIVQCAAALGSFACGVDAGVRAVLDAGAVPYLTGILSYPDEKVVDAGARSLRIIFQSKLAPKYDVLLDKNMKFLLSLLNSVNENVTELAASIITHSCETKREQKALCDAGVLQRLVYLLEGSLNQRDASLDSIAAIVKNNSEAVAEFARIGNGKALRAIIELMKDRYPRTRLLACVCLITIGHASPSHLQELEIKTKLILILVELLEEPSRAGDEAPFVLANLVASKEELQKQAISVNAVEKVSNFLRKNPTETKRLQGILLALAALCSALEKCRCQFMSLQVFDVVVDALKHECPDVRIAACACLKSLSRSVKNLSAGHFAIESVIIPLVQLLHDSSVSVQVAALGAICNIVVGFSPHTSVFIKCGGLKELVQLSGSMDSFIRLNAVWALRNLMFLADRAGKEVMLLELTESTLASLICDPEASIQEQALAVVRNLVDGCPDSIERIFAEGGCVLEAVARQMRGCSTPEVCIQGMFVFSNIATGNEFHKEAVIGYLLQPQLDECPKASIIKFLQSTDSLLKTAALWCIVNLTYPDSPNASVRASRLCDIGVMYHIKDMIDDPCLDVKFRAKTALQQFALLGYMHT